MVRMRKIVTVDERSRVTLGSATARPGEQFRIERYPDGHITLFPIEVTDAPQYEQGVVVAQVRLPAHPETSTPHDAQHEQQVQPGIPPQQHTDPFRPILAC